jgi:predicted nucleotidyltransferase
MVNRLELEKTIIKLKPILSEKYFVERIGYFGSYSRDEQTQESDIDILVDFRKPLGWAYFDLQELLENELKTRVDLVSVKALKEQLKDVILKEVRYL